MLARVVGEIGCVVVRKYTIWCTLTMAGGPQGWSIMVALEITPYGTRGTEHALMEPAKS